MHLFLFGTPGDADRRLAAMAAQITVVSRLTEPVAERTPAPLPFLGLPRTLAHFTVSQDYIQCVPPLNVALAEICDVLVSGGRFIFTVPFYYNEPNTELMPKEALAFAAGTPLEFRGQTHKFGWDLLDRLKQAGFRDAVAYLYWSEELGYLGSMNFIFRAIK
jgi:SAM-dependent methyltransferase